LACLVLLANGCNTLKSYTAAYIHPSSTPTVTETQRYTNLPPTRILKTAAKPAPRVSQPTFTSVAPKNDRTRAAAEAAAASAAALKASQEAAKAAAEAARAAARAGAPSPPPAGPTPTPPILSSSDTDDQVSEHQHAAAMIDSLRHQIAALDHQHLDVDGENRKEIGQGFLNNAQSAFDQGSYREAASLADKAFMILGPLARPAAGQSP
jgi:hypothetical protein